MNISDFIDKAVAWFGTTDKKLEALQPPDTSKLTADLAAATTRAEAAENTVAVLTEENGKLKAALDEATKTIADLPKLAAAKANEIAAAQGVPPVVEEKRVGASKTSNELWAEYAQLSDHKAKREFYLANKDRM